MGWNGRGLVRQHGLRKGQLGTGRDGTERVGMRGDGTGCSDEIHLRMNGCIRTEKIKDCPGTVVLILRLS
jgi:hypothetical protein